jgi:hypothetical protein
MRQVPVFWVMKMRLRANNRGTPLGNSANPFREILRLAQRVLFDNYDRFVAASARSRRIVARVDWIARRILSDFAGKSERRRAVR